MASFQCLKCSKSFNTQGKLNRHDKRMHAAAAAGSATTAATETTTATTPTVESLEIEHTKENTGSAASYHCASCGHSPVTKEDKECPACGATLDWSALND